MEDGEDKKEEDYASEPPKEDDSIKVKVIQPFKPSVRISRVVRQGKCYYHPMKPASYICASCGKSVCTVCGRDAGGVYFCPQCAPPQIPIAQSVPAKTEEPNVTIYRALFSIGIILIIIGAILFVAYWPLTSISAAEYENLLEDYWKDPDGPNGSQTGGHNFKEYRPGDVIVIKDTIVRVLIEQDPTWGVTTLFWFESTGPDDLDFKMRFDTDLERDYRVGDVVSITLHVTEDSRTQNEVIREEHNNIPDISNIDHTFSVDLVFISLIILGATCVLIYFLFTRKIRKQMKEKSEPEDKSQDKPKKIFTSRLHEGGDS